MRCDSLRTVGIGAHNTEVLIGFTHGCRSDEKRRRRSRTAGAVHGVEQRSDGKRLRKSRQATLDCGGKRSATPLSDVE